MRYYIALALFLGLYVSSTAQTITCDTIAWTPQVKLTWDNFKGKPNPGTTFKALTRSGMFLATHSDDKHVELHSGTQFFSCTSWTIVNSDSVLRHEQLHFDITEVYRRQFFKAMSQGSFSKKDWNEKLNTIYRQINMEWQKEQDRYDDETNHGIIRSKQLEWEARVKDRMKDLEPFGKEGITIIFK